jgi:hypothetical protein
MPDVINKVISLFTGESEPASDKDILLRQLAKDISQNKYAKFYRTRQAEIDPSLGQYFYSLYKMVYPLQQFLKDPLREAKIRQVTLESFLDKQVMDVIKRLSPGEIDERRKNPGDDLPKQLQDELTALAKGFDNPKVAVADKCYNLITSMKRFVFFDFCSMLRKFDQEMKPGDFLTQPKFSAVDASIVAADISAFLSVLPPLDEDGGWKTVFEILKYCKGGTDVIPPILWNNLLLSLKDIKQSKILDLINKLITSNPVLEIKAAVPNETLSAYYLEQKTREVQEVIAMIAGSQRDAQIRALEQAVFGSLTVTRLNFYTTEKGRVFADKELESYTYAPALNHLLTFIQEFLSREIQELCDILLIRGQWTNNSASRQMSEAFHEVLDITPEIAELDESLEEDGSNGPRLRGALLRVDRDKTQIRYINSIVRNINEEALDMINRAVPSLIVVGKHLKMVMDDFEKKPFELIMNWKELIGVSKAPINQRIVAAYKKINYFVQLMIMETKQVDE